MKVCTHTLMYTHCSSPCHASTSHRKEWEGVQTASIRRTPGMIWLGQEQRDKCTRLYVVPWSCHMHGCVHRALMLACAPDAWIQQPTRGLATLAVRTQEALARCVCRRVEQCAISVCVCVCLWRGPIVRVHWADIVMFSAESEYPCRGSVFLYRFHGCPSDVLYSMVASQSANTCHFSHLIRQVQTNLSYWHSICLFMAYGLWPV